MSRHLPIPLLAAALCGCAAVSQGTSQELAFDSAPPGADCTLNREGLPIAKVTTPGKVKVDKTKHDIQVACKKDGYQDGTAFLKSGVEGWTLGNIILGGGIGWAIDSATGADNKYPEAISVTLVPVNAQQPVPAAPAPESPAPPVTAVEPKAPAN